MQTFRTTRRVEFSDTDAAGIAHYSRFFIFMEIAEHELLRSLGLSVMQRDGEQLISWPRVSVTCEYRLSAKFEDVLDIDVGIERLGSKSITYVFRFSRAGQLLATGKTTAVCCRIEHDAPPKSIDIPRFIAEKLAPLVAAAA